MANLKDVIYLSAEDYNTLYTNGTITINGVTLTYDANNVYIVPDNTQQQIDDILALIPSSATTSNKLATMSDLPTTLPASDVYSWAKASTKPSYSYNEISNTPNIMTITKVTGNNIDLNTYKETGIYLGEYQTYDTLLNKPNVTDFNAGFVLFVIKFGGGYSCQFFMCYGTNGSLYSRTMYYTNGSYVFTSWTTT